MTTPQNTNNIHIAPGRTPWPHEFRVAKILAHQGYRIEFLPETNLHTPDILLNDIPYEIKSPISFNSNSLEHTLKRATKQSPNLIIDTSRLKNVPDNKVISFFINQVKKQKQIKHLLLITKSKRTIDISSLL